MMKFLPFMIFTVAEANLPPLCIHCKFFKADPWMNKFGKCTKFPNEERINYFYVNGKPDTRHKDYYYCSTTRALPDMCGPEGKLFEKK
jgi:hypothetical protein